MWNPKTDEQLGKGWKRWSKILKPQLPSSLGTSVLGMESAEAPEDGSPSCWGCGHRGNRKQDGCHPHRCTKSKNAPPFPHKTCLPYAHIWICICVCVYCKVLKKQSFTKAPYFWYAQNDKSCKSNSELDSLLQNHRWISIWRHNVGSKLLLYF